MIRLVTFNVRHGRGDDGRVDAARLGAALAALDPDVVALQEVDRAQDRSERADLLGAVEEAIGARETRFVPTLTGQVGLARHVRTSAESADVQKVSSLLRTWSGRRRARGDEADGPSYGIALLSRHPVSAWRRLRLPTVTPYLVGLQLGPDEPRAALAAVVETPDGPLTVVGTHLSSWGRWNRAQLWSLRRHLRAAPRPLVLLGDLNIRGALASRITGWRELVHVPTYPAARPFLQIDHVLADGDVDAAGPARALDLGLSDHRAVVVDVTLGRRP
ncbi:endonuclease/exonuclease/phosphatase family metal-dependent hydrolase [Isoptericola variabilis J7]|uniref:Endonuclease/exonuclease/phosphatase n=1 Tax=Isoptericola variabilis (strain 225) TaxID=743718 RepID=F6FQP8_ISOV2|nr:Endonuclease/exonuclease/phosphatase [Isoptericola variabilis 225]TWH31003.1 endonuclease/exonuclease/phosphatase family metal-dependent hydrolase [Isoptericola variabilis J7]